MNSTSQIETDNMNEWNKWMNAASRSPFNSSAFSQQSFGTSWTDVEAMLN